MNDLIKKKLPHPQHTLPTKVQMGLILLVTNIMLETKVFHYSNMAGNQIVYLTALVMFCKVKYFKVRDNVTMGARAQRSSLTVKLWGEQVLLELPYS